MMVVFHWGARLHCGRGWAVPAGPRKRYPGSQLPAQTAMEEEIRQETVLTPRTPSSVAIYQYPPLEMAEAEADPDRTCGDRFFDRLEFEVALLYSLFRNHLRPTAGRNYTAIITPAVLALLPAIYLIDMLAAISLCPGQPDALCPAVWALPWGSLRPSDVAVRPATLLTYALHHLDATHLISNWLITLAVYAHLERRLGWARILLAKVLTAFGSATLWWWLGRDGYMMGYSGVVYGGCLLYLVDGLLNWGEANSGAEGARRSVLVWVTVVVALGVSVVLDLTLPSLQNVAVLAHAGGALAGCAYSFWGLPNYHVRTWERVAQGVAFLVFVLHMVVLPLSLSLL